MRRTIHRQKVILSLGCICGFILGAVQQCRRDNANDTFSAVESLRKGTSMLHRDSIFERVRILCWIMTTKKNYAKAAFSMKAWARRCNKLIFVSDSEGDGLLPLYNAKVNDSSGKGLWFKVQAEILQDPRSDKDAGCRRNVSTSEEEPMLAECLHAKVLLGDTRDQHGLNTFHQNPMLEVLFNAKSNGTWKKHYRELQYWLSMANHSQMCCTNYPISFHYLPSKSLFKLEFLIGHVNPFDVGFLMKPKI